MRHNSTIIPKKRKLDCGCFDYAFSKNRCKYHAIIANTQKRMELATEEMIKEEDLSDLISDADRVFSQFIRLKYCDRQGRTPCYTCRWVKHWSLQQCGHYIKRGHLYLRWDERNCKPQCSECNELKDGNIPEYTKRLETESPGITTILQEEMRIIHKPTRAELKQIVAGYAPKVAALKKSLTT